jgi:predicted MPP superfamily phosphohydrolase
VIPTEGWSVHVGGGAAGEMSSFEAGLMITRRSLLTGLAALGFCGSSIGAYAFGIEPRFMLSVTRYQVTPDNWPEGLHLRFAILADIHAGDPYMPLDRIAEIVARTNALDADAILLLGDYGSKLRWVTREISPHEFARAVADLKAPLGVHAVLGNHDRWDDPVVQQQRKGPPLARRALEQVGIPVYENDAVRLDKSGHPFWLAGLGDLIAFRLGKIRGKQQFLGVDDLPGTLAKVADRAPVILMAHEPDIFPDVPKRVALTISGHTHGGQVRIAGYSPIVPSAFGNRYAYGHVIENDRHLIVSGGLGCSKLPVRFGVPPEIVVVALGVASPSVGSPSLTPV